jgi:hypothetical protein
MPTVNKKIWYIETGREQIAGQSGFDLENNSNRTSISA